MANEVTAPPFLTFRFEVDIIVENGPQLGLSNRLCSAAFSEAGGLEASMSPKILKEGGNNREQIHLVGPVTYNQLTLKRGMTSTMDLWKWFAVVTGLRSPTGARADIEVRVLGPTGDAQITYKLQRCLPVKIKAPSLEARGGGLAIEEMTVAYSKFSVQVG